MANSYVTAEWDLSDETRRGRNMSAKTSEMSLCAAIKIVYVSAYNCTTLPIVKSHYLHPISTCNWADAVGVNGLCDKLLASCRVCTNCRH